MGSASGIKLRNVGLLLGLCVILGYKPVAGKVTLRDPTSLSNGIVEYTGSVKLSCGATCSNGTCTFAWSPTSFTKILSKSYINITNLSREKDNATRYTLRCTVKDNGDNDVKTCTRTLELLYPPDITINQTKNDLTCYPSGRPPKYTFKSWQHSMNGVFIRNLPGQNSLTTTRLTLESTYQGSGEYKCVVQNSIEDRDGVLSQTKSINIVQKDIPVVLTPLNTTEKVSKGDSLLAVIKVYSFPQIQTVNVFKDVNNSFSNVNNVKTSNRTDHVDVTFHEKVVNTTGEVISLHINGMKEVDFGKYTIVIENNVGQANVTTTIIPQGPPDTPNEFNVKERFHNCIVFQLKSGFYNGANQTLQIQYRKDFNGSEWINGTSLEVGSENNLIVEMRVEGLEPESLYAFNAYSYNRFYSSGGRELNSIWTDEEPDNLAVIGGAVGGSIVGVIIILVLVVVFCKRKSCKSYVKKSKPRMLPKVEMNNILAGNSDQIAFPVTPIYENSELKSGSNSNIYENTETEKRSPKVENNKANQDSNYANLPVFTGVSSFKTKNKSPSSDAVIYSNTDDMVGINKARTPASVSETNEKSYANVLVKDSIVEDDGDYLDMDLNLKCQTENSKSSANLKGSNSFSKFDNNNGKRVKGAGHLKKTQEVKGPSEVYMDMDTRERDSLHVPDFDAPPPPSPHTPKSGVGYVNLS